VSEWGGWRIKNFQLCHFCRFCESGRVREWVEKFLLIPNHFFPRHRIRNSNFSVFLLRLPLFVVVLPWETLSLYFTQSSYHTTQLASFPSNWQHEDKKEIFFLIFGKWKLLPVVRGVSEWVGGRKYFSNFSNTFYIILQPSLKSIYVSECHTLTPFYFQKIINGWH
jgi:hypothetical protein